MAKKDKSKKTDKRKERKKTRKKKEEKKFSGVEEIVEVNEKKPVEQVAEGFQEDISQIIQGNLRQAPVLERIASRGEVFVPAGSRVFGEEESEEVKYSNTQATDLKYSGRREGNANPERILYNPNEKKKDYLGRGARTTNTAGEWGNNSEKENIGSGESRGRDVFLEELGEKYSPGQEYR